MAIFLGKKKGKNGVDNQRAQAIEFKSIIQEMVDELQYMEKSSDELPPGSDKGGRGRGGIEKSFTGRRKDISNFESLLQARRKKLVQRLKVDKRYNEDLDSIYPPSNALKVNESNDYLSDSENPFYCIKMSFFIFFL